MRLTNSQYKFGKLPLGYGIQQHRVSSRNFPSADYAVVWDSHQNSVEKPTRDNNQPIKIANGNFSNYLDRAVHFRHSLAAADCRLG